MKLKFGTDPETFLSLGGRFISAAGILPGTKSEPYKVEKGAVQVDGLAFEFNIDPVDNAEDFNNNIEIVLKQMEEMVKKVDPDIQINFTPIAKFDLKYFNSLPDEFKVLGCDPDYTYSGKVKTPPDIFDRPFRTAAGHFHIGWTENEDPMDAVHFEDCKTVARYFNKKFAYARRTKEEAERLMWYGNLGAFRPKHYGVELREFSNLWVKTPESRKKMFNTIAKGMNEIAEGA